MQRVLCGICENVLWFACVREEIVVKLSGFNGILSVEGEAMFIREACPEDCHAIAVITAEGLGYECAPEIIAKNIAALDQTHAKLFVAECSGEVVGFVEPQVYEAVYFAPLVNILGLAVRESQRGQGIGRALMDAAEQWARKIGATGIRLNSGSTRTNAHGFYRHIGYTSEKQQIRFLKEF